MSLSFNCGPYEDAFRSKRLQNWEKRNCHRPRPLTKSGYTQCISNDRGHLLPSIPRSARSPWGSYVGTWDLPNKLPGNKQTDPTARSADAYFRNIGHKGEADAVIYGKTKLRRAKAGQPLEAMPTHCDPPVNVTATHQEVRSGAANPFVKGTPPRQGSAPQRTLTPQHMPLDDNCNAANEFNPQLSYSPPPMRMSPSGGQMPPIAGGYGGVASPNRCSPLPPMPASPMQRTSPQIRSPMPTSPIQM